MGDQDRGEQLPKRVPGAGEGQPAPSPSRPLPQQLRQRLQAAVTAERARTAGHPQPEPARHLPPEPARHPQPEPARHPQPEPARHPQPEPARHPQPEPARPVTSGSPDRPPAAAGTPAAGHRAAIRPASSRAGARQAGAARHLFAATVIAVTLVLVAAGSLGVAVARYLAAPPPVRSQPISRAQARADALSRRLAAAWVAQQVDPDAPVSCDQLMCQALVHDGFPARSVNVLGPTAPYPTASAVVIVTQAIRDLFGSSLSSDYAPAVLATFGSGAAGITVRVVAPHGAAAYQRELAADLAARKSTGANLVTLVTMSAQARRQLLAGLVDSRLLLAIASLEDSTLPVDILDFGDPGPGADPTIPLRFADMAEPPHLASSAYIRAVRADLTGTIYGETGPAKLVTVLLPGGRHVLRIEFTAPTPLDLLKSQ